jgi:ubiquinone/menaquinone biosynthesis C-methylase UbiE
MQADYVLGRTSAEHERLARQAATLRPSTERMLRAAGIGAGMRVLDVGCGVGDVSLLVAEIVGPSGEVVGVDVDEAAVAVARRRAEESGIRHATFVVGDMFAAHGEPFDAAVGRLVLMYQTDATDALRRIASKVRPGGIVAFQELASGAIAWQLSQLPLFASVVRWVRGAFAASGAHVNLGLELYWRMRDAGLTPHPSPLAEAPLEVGPESSTYTRWASLARSLAPRIVEYGLATEVEMDLDTLEQRLRDEALAARATVPSFSGLVVGQWARRPE